jgi:two-component system NtrC family sensor kinase
MGSNSLQAVNGHGQITVTLQERGDQIEVMVADNGCGISTERLARVFEPFYTTKPQGTGLGLAVAQGIIKDHGGQIIASSSPGSGTKMTIFLPSSLG